MPTGRWVDSASAGASSAALEVGGTPAIAGACPIFACEQFNYAVDFMKVTGFGCVQDRYRHALQTYMHPEMPLDQGIIAALHTAKVPTKLNMCHQHLHYRCHRPTTVLRNSTAARECSCVWVRMSTANCTMQGGRELLAARRSAWDAAFNALFMQLRNGATDAFYCISPQVSRLLHNSCMIGNTCSCT